MYIIAGLGNPDAKYERTRHNAGFLALDALAESVGVSVDKKDFNALTGTCIIAGEKCLLMKPQTYMNRSGAAVGEAARFYKVPPEHIIVFSDDIALEPGKLRIRKSGSAGGHNGLKDIIAALGTEAFPRVRIGVGERTIDKMDLADHVLGKIPDDQWDVMKEAFEDAADAAKIIVMGYIEKAMNLYN